MKNVRFYLEFEGPKAKRRGTHSGNVFARDTEHSPRGSGDDLMVDGVGAADHIPNAPVESTSASLSYLRTHCKRISEPEARKIHPRLFGYLERRVPEARSA